MHSSRLMIGACILRPARLGDAVAGDDDGVEDEDHPVDGPRGERGEALACTARVLG